MPELPEVETMVRGLRPVMAGKTLASIQVLDPHMLVECTASELESRVTAAHVESVHRRGKWVVFTFDDPAGLIVIEPRMTGGFWLIPPERPDHVRLMFTVRGRRDPVWFCDTRRLGKIHWFRDSGEAQAAFQRSHGPDALEIGLEELSGRLGKTGRAIKPALVDQKLLAGIGNIYADEILFRARIHPSRVASGLTKSELERLQPAIGQVLEEAIKAEGSSFDAGYRTVLGLEGGFLAQNAMYGRGNQPCPCCGGPIQKTRIPGLIGRPTHFCPHCQPLRVNKKAATKRKA